MWVRGLKHYLRDCLFRLSKVAPHVGAWIETYRLPLLAAKIRRTPCGCVD